MYSMIVVVYEPKAGAYYGGAVAGPVFKNVAEKVYALKTKPVSYTHLRAHETVLDIVCRLLLEKKKNIQKEKKKRKTNHPSMVQVVREGDIRTSCVTRSQR